MRLHFQRSIDIFLFTWPFLLLRLGVYLVVLAGAAMWFSAVFLLYRNWFLPGPNFTAWIFGGALFIPLAKLVRQYLLYLLKAAQVAVITQLAVHGCLPQGKGQLAYGKDLVLDHFLKVSVLFVVDRLVNLVLRAFNRSVFAMLNIVPGIGGLRRFAQRVLDYSAGYVDEAILSYSLLHPNDNPWTSARDGLLLYVQNWKTILGLGAILALINYGLLAVAAVPALLLHYAGGGFFAPMSWMWMIGIALILKFALMDPFALTVIIVNYQAAIAGQSINPAWDQRLEQISDKYREMKNRASEWLPDSGPAPATAPPSGGGIRIP